MHRRVGQHVNVRVERTDYAARLSAQDATQRQADDDDDAVVIATKSAPGRRSTACRRTVYSRVATTVTVQCNPRRNGGQNGGQTSSRGVSRGLVVRTLCGPHGGGTGTRRPEFSVGLTVRPLPVAKPPGSWRSSDVKRWGSEGRDAVRGRGWACPGQVAGMVPGTPRICLRQTCRRPPWNDGMLFHGWKLVADWRNESGDEGCHSTAPDRTRRVAGPCR